MIADEVYQFLEFPNPTRPKSTLPPPLFTYTHGRSSALVNNIIGMNSFSKIIAPGLRLGWIQGSETVLHAIEKRKWHSPFCIFVIPNFGQQQLEYYEVEEGSILLLRTQWHTWWRWREAGCLGITCRSSPLHTRGWMTSCASAWSANFLAHPLALVTVSSLSTRLKAASSFGSDSTKNESPTLGTSQTTKYATRQKVTQQL